MGAGALLVLDTNVLVSALGWDGPERTERVAFVEDVRADTLLVQPTRRVSAIEDDPDDNHVLACAVTAGADFIVSGDRHLLDLRSFEGIPIRSAREFLETAADLGGSPL